MKIQRLTFNQNGKLVANTSEIIGLLLFGFSLFLILTLLTYSPLDPSINTLMNMVGGGPLEIHNVCGIIGAYMADIFYQALGVGSYLLIIPFLFFSFVLFASFEPKRLGIKITGYSLLLLSFSGLASLLHPNMSIDTVTVKAGGIMGHFIVSVLIPLTSVGTYIFLPILFIISIILISEKSFKLFLVQFKNIAAFVLTKCVSAIMFKLGKMRRRKEVVKITDKVDNAPPTIKEKPAPKLPARQRQKIEEPPVLQESFEFCKNAGDYILPSISLLKQTGETNIPIDKELILMNSKLLEKKFSDFDIAGKIVEVKPGPVITMYEFEPAPDVKLTRIVALSDDIAMALRAPSIRIQAPIPGKSVVGIEIPNLTRQTVMLRDIIHSETYRNINSKLTIAMGKDIEGEPNAFDLGKMPHLLVAGATGSGKSVFINTLIMSILYNATPDEVKFIMIDPKRLELSTYEAIPHLLLPVVTEPKNAQKTLKWAVYEMERRYIHLSEMHVRNIESYNKKIQKHIDEKGEPPKVKVYNRNNPPVENLEGQAPEPAYVEEVRNKLPYIVILVDELADLLMTSGKDTEELITRLAQMARAAGIHLVLATQRPSTDVITGLIKANFPARVSFQVASKYDARTILDTVGSENLLGMGDMLFLPPNASRLTRLHGAYVSDSEINKVVGFIKNQRTAEYETNILSTPLSSASGASFEAEEEMENDELYDQAVSIVSEMGKASISMLQRRLRVGYNRAARMIEKMEEEGIVGPTDGIKPRELLVNRDTPPQQ